MIQPELVHLVMQSHDFDFGFQVDLIIKTSGQSVS